MAVTIQELAHILTRTDPDKFPDSSPVKVWDPRTEEFFEISAIVPETVHPEGPMIEIHVVTEPAPQEWGA